MSLCFVSRYLYHYTAKSDTLLNQKFNFNLIWAVMTCYVNASVHVSIKYFSLISFVKWDVFISPYFSWKIVMSYILTLIINTFILQNKIKILKYFLQSNEKCDKNVLDRNPKDFVLDCFTVTQGSVSNFIHVLSFSHFSNFFGHYFLLLLNLLK